MASVDVALTDLRGDEPLAGEDADGEPTEAHEQNAHDVILVERGDQRRDVDEVVLACVREPEGRPDRDDLVLELETNGVVAVPRAPRRALEELEALASVLTQDVAAGDPRFLPRRI